MRLSKYIGNTPMIKISDKIYAKAELFNPTGSIKDRPATHIINDAEKKGLIKKGDTIKMKYNDNFYFWDPSMSID